MDEPAGEKVLNVVFGELFSKYFVNFPIDDRKKIFDFAVHIGNQGFNGLPGRNKASIDVDKNDHKFIEKVQFARDNNLYHYPTVTKTFPSKALANQWARSIETQIDSGTLIDRSEAE